MSNKQSLITTLAGLIDVPTKGGRVKIDPDFLSGTLPKDLTADNFNRSVQHIVDLTEAAEVALATKCIAAAGEDAEFDMADLELNVAPSLRLSATWHRKSRRSKADGHFEEVYGTLLSTATLTTSSDHQDQLRRLEETAASILNV